MSPVKRSRSSRRAYDSPRRREQAQTTRDRLMASARRLFAASGYAATSIEAIAADAGVAAQTFYATYGSKRAVLFALLDDPDVQVDVARLQEELAAATTPRQQLAHLVAFSVRFYQQEAELVEIARSAGNADADLAALWREGEGRRKRGQVSVVREWAARSALREGLKKSKAADILWSLTGADCHRLFVKELGWSAPQYQAWLTEALETLLFR